MLLYCSPQQQTRNFLFAPIRTRPIEIVLCADSGHETWEALGWLVPGDRRIAAAS